MGSVRTSRRKALVGGAAIAAVGAMEYASLGGRFDHRRLQTASGADRYKASLARLDADPVAAAGALVHVGHSTHLLSVGGVRMLTDPWFYDPAFGALSHVFGPAVAPEDVGPLQAVLVTHDHADHADLRAMDRLDKGAHAFVATRELAARVRLLGFAAVDTLAEWESAVVGAARVTAVPAEHDIYEIGYVIDAGDRVAYFAGDTRLFDGIRAIAERFRPSLAILPVDGTRVTGGGIHVMTPADAVEATRILAPKAAVPSHAEAYLSDPLAKYVLASTVDGAGGIFVELLGSALPKVTGRLPMAGECVAFD